MSLKQGVVVTKKVVNLLATQFTNKDDANNVIPGQKSILVSMAGGYSFRAKEGDDNFADIVDFVRTGTVLSVSCSGIKPSPYNQTQQTASGSEVEVTAYFQNLEDPEIVAIEEAERKEAFSNLQKREDSLTFAIKEGRARRQKGSVAPETLPEGADSATAY